MTTKFEIGDRVIRVYRDYDKTIKVGTLGTVLTVEEKSLQIAYDDACIVWTTKDYNKLITETPQQKETATMNLKITTSHTVQGKETKELSASTQASLIKEQQNKIKALEDVEPKTKKITASLKELREELATFVAHLDSLPE